MRDLSRHRAPYTLSADGASGRILILRIRSDFTNLGETQDHEECCSKLVVVAENRRAVSGRVSSNSDMLFCSGRIWRILPSVQTGACQATKSERTRIYEDCNELHEEADFVVANAGGGCAGPDDGPDGDGGSNKRR